MKRAMNGRRFSADVLHDVDLATVGPMNRVDIFTQHPKCRPDTLAKGNLDSRFEPTVLLTELLFGEQPGRSIVPRYLVGTSESFFHYCDNQRAILDVGVDSTTGVSLEFVVAPAVAAYVKRPSGRVNR